MTEEERTILKKDTTIDLILEQLREGQQYVVDNESDAGVVKDESIEEDINARKDLH